MQKFATINGKKIAYTDVGQGQPIICVHGWAMHKDMFNGLSEALSGHFRVISLDLAGHGASHDVKGPFTIERAADDLFALCESLELTNIIALGWSMGMHVWWDLISRYGEGRLAGLVIEDMSPKVYNTVDWHHGTLNGRTVDGIEQMLEEMCQDWTTFSYRFVPRIFAKGLGDKWVALADRVMHDTLKNDPKIMASYWRSMAKQDYRSLLPNLETPVLIAQGGLSQLYGSDVADYLSQNIKQSEIVNFAQSGHAPHLEQPELFTKTLAVFAAKHNKMAAFTTNHKKQVKTTIQQTFTTKGEPHVEN